MNLRLRARLKERKIKNKKNQTQNSPQENLNKVDKDINNSADKENNCMNKVSQENKSELKSSFEEVYEKEMQPKTKESDNALDLKHSDCDSYGEESREIDELKAFLKNWVNLFFKPVVSGSCLTSPGRAFLLAASGVGGASSSSIEAFE